MKIKKLTLDNFMAFGNAQIDWSDNINIICGENSTGKTTLLFFDKTAQQRKSRNINKRDGRAAICKKDSGDFSSR